MDLIYISQVGLDSFSDVNDAYCLPSARSLQNTITLNTLSVPHQYHLNVPLGKPSVVSERFSFSRSITQQHEGREGRVNAHNISPSSLKFPVWRIFH